MTITIPNYFLEQEHSKIIMLASGLYIEYNKMDTQKTFIRNTMHGILFVWEGIKKVHIEREDFSLDSSQIMLFSQGHYFSSENSKDYRGFILFFDDTFVLNFLKKYKIDVLDHRSDDMRIRCNINEDIEIIIGSIEHKLYQTRSYQKPILALQMDILILELLQQDPKNIKAFFKQITITSTYRMKHILEQNLDIIETVEDMHKLMRMNPSNFSKKFLKIFGCSPKAWLDEQRMKKAALLLLQSSKSIAEIATDCRYATSSWFIVQFKKYYKVTPKEYRNKNRY